MDRSRRSAESHGLTHEPELAPADLGRDGRGGGRAAAVPAAVAPAVLAPAGAARRGGDGAAGAHGVDGVRVRAPRVATRALSPRPHGRRERMPAYQTSAISA